MASDPMNPFGIPGLNHLSGANQGNPLATSMDMMRNAMSTFGQSASLAGGSLTQSLNPEDLERRIGELKTVENWLKLNLSMLSSSIQGMEVQLATIKTLRSFVELGSQARGADEQEPSPLEIVLGLKQKNPAAGTKASAPVTPPEAGSEPAAQASTATAAKAVPDAPAMPAADDTTAAAKAWWDMLQGQFAQLAAATATASQFAPPRESAAPVAGKPAARSKPVAAKRARKASTPKKPKTS